MYMYIYLEQIVIFFFFFFKQKTAYEMQRGLVGSEMCIRDRVSTQSTWVGIGIIYKQAMPKIEDVSFSKRAIEKFHIELCETVVKDAELTSNLAIFKDKKRVATLEYIKPLKIMDNFKSLHESVQSEAMHYFRKLMNINLDTQSNISSIHKELAWRTLFNLHAENEFGRGAIRGLSLIHI
eukprot:TRINITY_DN18893_c0_g1_i3.p1 TRINITY_DN18893_c0_g1~~TRINITY_DN18893_c0_g1_i3.p1  ORF type:complete len:180 (-),score=45.85 TRINITY_DN18893_c0_g1_i3:169-708(-)